MAAPALTTPNPRKALILCFDGTGDKFQGTSADSNIVKLFNLLDREDANHYHYYQPGIGTYVETGSLAQESRLGRIKSWYVKAKDEAVGTSFGEHVMAGYKFLMRYYSPGAAIYFFGFSRGSYTARFLAQMLDYIGLLSTGNEEMLRFAWKTFAQWQIRTDSIRGKKSTEHETFQFMQKFRETFSRPIDPIRFIGLFDCVNSVPQFEAAWMSRSKFPYTAQTSAEIIRHAVSIDERRAKFRQDLVSELEVALPEHVKQPDAIPKSGEVKKADGTHSQPALFRPRHGRHRTGLPHSTTAPQNLIDLTTTSHEQQERGRHGDESQTMKYDKQDILEVWFAGQHGDIGGGWSGEAQPASDLPLMWMVREAQRAGVPFDQAKLRAAHLLFDEPQKSEPTAVEVAARPVVELSEAVAKIHCLETKSRLHDSLSFGGGLSWSSVVAWKLMEHLPFRRMDLQPDGSWKPISWPLPRGETRDMPPDAKVHSSVIRRMEANEEYRPGNLLVAGGSRGVRRAPKSVGIGSWRVVRDQGDPIGEVVVRDRSTVGDW